MIRINGPCAESDHPPEEMVVSRSERILASLVPVTNTRARLFNLWLARAADYRSPLLHFLVAEDNEQPPPGPHRTLCDIRLGAGWVLTQHLVVPPPWLVFCALCTSHPGLPADVVTAVARMSACSVPLTRDTLMDRTNATRLLPTIERDLKAAA